MQTSISRIGAISLVAVLAGCNVGPKYTRPNVPAPPAYRGADDAAVASAAQGSLGDEKWADVFRDPQMQALIQEALKNNYDLRIAAERIAEQQAQVRITRAGQLPTLGATVEGVGPGLPIGQSSGSGNNNSSSGSSSSNTQGVGVFGLSAVWNPDFWGLYRKQTEAQKAKLLGQVWAQREVRMTLVEQVAAAYIQLRTLDNELEIAKSTVKSRQDSLGLTSRLEKGGAAPLSDVRQAEQLLYTATAEIPQLEQQIQQQENAIHVLLGDNPGPIVRTGANVVATPPLDLPVGLPSQLLERRPDIQQVETDLVAANANIGVARAQFFPQLSINGVAELAGESFPSIFNGSGKSLYLLGSLTQAIFEGGKLKGQVQLAEAQQRELVLTYGKTVQGAFRDVSNALIAVNKQKAYREEQEKLVASAQDAVRLARMRYQGGATSYLEVLTTDSNLFTAQLSLAQAQQAEALTLVQLYQALGGGWQ
ncbi:MAG: efflux transporter outer membrane subunit [Acidobacteriota bacterium]